MVSLYRPDLPSQSWQVSRLFLAGLLDALLPSVHGALATSLLGHLLTSLLVCRVVSMYSFRRCTCSDLWVAVVVDKAERVIGRWRWLIGEVGYGVGTYRLAAWP